MAFSLHYAAASDIGLGRYKNNQDSGYAGPHLLVVADGMGGAAGGDVASSTVVSELVPLDTEGPGPEASRDLVNAILRANDAMGDQVEADASLQGMGSTVTAVLRTGSQLVLAHVGDSRAYLLRDGELTQLTHDHTFVQRLIDTGQITPEEAERHPQRSVILRVVGHMEGDEVDLSTFTPNLGDRLLLCSDGLPRVVTDKSIAEGLVEGDPQEAADRLVQLALRAGGPDNITVVVADIVNSTSAPPLRQQVVGAAASVRNIPTAARGSAARAAALTAPQPDESADDEEEDTPPDRPWWARSTLVALLVLALLAAAVFAANQWRSSQYFVGSYAGRVATFRGLNTTLGPLHLYHVETIHQDLPLSKVPASNRDNVEHGLPGGSYATAQQTLRTLYNDAGLCPAPGTKSSSSAAPTAPAVSPSSSSAKPKATPSPKAKTKNKSKTSAKPSSTSGAATISGSSSTTSGSSPSSSATTTRAPGCDR